MTLTGGLIGVKIGLKLSSILNSLQYIETNPPLPVNGIKLDQLLRLNLSQCSIQNNVESDLPNSSKPGQAHF